jgi:hypothetical protein
LVAVLVAGDVEEGVIVWCMGPVVKKSCLLCLLFLDIHVGRWLLLLSGRREVLDKEEDREARGR